MLISTPIGITVTGLILEELTASILIIIIGTLTVLTAVISYILILRQESIYINPF
ncbi:hypothetical protein [Bacillus sp. AFS014408]|uniref:hypothetical protein n=1 Tax=Bacillus sp. AFS014408 TaxID=2034278 RepID=UPI001596F103|nr:hypothetical protein [Bacillus sp. AFS014408]